MMKPNARPGLGRISFRIAFLSVSIVMMTSAGIDGETDRAERPVVRVLNEMLADYDGNEYRLVRIGSQVWMAENLKVTHYRNGTPIPEVSPDTEWLLAVEGAYCVVESEFEYRETYGVLYNHYAVSSDCGLCPDGWHVPTEQECMILIEGFGGMEIAGEAIKDNKDSLWKHEGTLATGESGFGGLPAGGRGRLGPPGEVGYYATWWSSTSSDELYAWHWGLYPDKIGIRANPGHKASGFSVRCIRGNGADDD